MSYVVVCIALGVDLVDVAGGCPCLRLYSLADRVTWKSYLDTSSGVLPEYFPDSFLLFRLVLLGTSSYNWCRVWAMSHPYHRICTPCAQYRGPGSDNIFIFASKYARTLL
jgi:hypothetical protein